jgi:cobalt-zinc-cadmium resistance protein CzcA
MGVHQTDVWVVLKPEKEWRKGITKEDIVTMIEPYMKTEPGLAYNFTQPIAMRVDELTSGVKSDLAVKIYGEDLDVLTRIGENIAGLLPLLEGTDNFFIEQTAGQPYLTVDIDREAAASFGLNVDAVQMVIEAGIGGGVAGVLYEGQRSFDIILRYPEDVRNELYKIQDVPVHLPGGGFVPLKRVADINLQEGPREIQRENGWRRLIVAINIKDIDLGTYVSDLENRIREQAEIPSGYFIDYGGTFENQRRAMRHLLLVVPLSIFIIIGLLYLNFGQMKYAILILMNLPFALSGGVFFLWLRGMYLSVSASIGFVALFGVAVLNGIVMIDHINELRNSKIGIKKAVLDGATNRLRPVLMTALVASLGFIPMAFNTGPGSEVQRPLATVVIGGLITSTMLTLMVLPVIYYWMEGRKEIKK